ncbi:MAG: response regulator [Yoonia sp.]|nr:response regulator [Yoonia sp.]
MNEAKKTTHHLRNQSDPSVTSNAKRVLLVEDNDDDRENIANMILDGNNGVSVHAAATGDQALAFFKEHGADCVILDYRLEAEDGLDVLAALKKIAPFVPVIMLTGQGNEEIAATSIKVGAADYLVKQRLNETYLRTSIDNAISRAALELRVADQDAERSQFLNILVHDLRQPLRNVRTLGEMANEEMEAGDHDELKKLLVSQATAATRADELIKTLEGYAMLDQDVAYTSISLSDAATMAKENYAMVIAERRAEVIIRDLPKVHGNRWQMMQVFQNLIGNGLKYNESPNPQIIIESESESESEATVAIVVKDNGIGVAQKHVKSIFSPLKRLWTHEQYIGTGLGLATCDKIVAGHNAMIWCTSTEGEGSQFHIRFPKFVA